MGAGHEGASRELARRLEQGGLRTVVADFLDAFPFRLGAAWQRSYRFEMRYVPSSYESTYQLFYRFPRLWGPFVSFERLLSGRRVLEWIDEIGPSVVVSTYSFATLVLGRLREEGRVSVPTVNFLTDFGVHPRAVHPSIDLNLAVHEVPATRARQLTTSPTVVAGAAVAPEFHPDRVKRREARRLLGVGDDERVVLVAAGSWGISHDLVGTVASLVRSGHFRVVTVCGSDHVLRRRLERRRLGTVIGWTDEMAGLMAAADVLVENAGGLTSLEGFATGLPVVSFHPIPGHGRDNVAGMAEAGVTTVAADRAELLSELVRLSQPGDARDRQIAAGRALFDHDPADQILRLASGASHAGPARPAYRTSPAQEAGDAPATRIG